MMENERRLTDLIRMRERLELELMAVNRWITAIEQEINDAEIFARPQREVE